MISDNIEYDIFHVGEPMLLEHRQTLEMASLNWDSYNQMNHSNLKLKYQGHSFTILDEKVPRSAQLLKGEIVRFILNAQNGTINFNDRYLKGVKTWISDLKKSFKNFTSNSKSLEKRPSDLLYFQDRCDVILETIQPIKSFGILVSDTQKLLDALRICCDEVIALKEEINQI